ncbi:MAG: HSP90 family protein [Kineosporiaceae bacterium]
MTDQRFQVDLRGLVDLLSHHLYSSPRVYVRELLPNAVDAVTARATRPDPGEPRIVLVPADVAADGRLHCLDTGVGLDETEVERFLATIGSSSKRDELGFARSDFLGQFGIGLLSAFLISDEITVLSRSARGGPAVLWQGSSDGSYRARTLDPAEEAEAYATRPATGWSPQEPGTWVALRPRPDTADWVGRIQVEALAAEYGRMLPSPVHVATATGDAVLVSTAERPWDRPGGVAAAREDLETLAGTPALAVFPVSVPEAGLRGAALIVDHPAAPTVRPTGRVYAKGMLVGADLEGVLPEWAFFARCVVNADQLRLTASREALYDDDLLEQVRVSLGEQLRRWMLRTAEVNPETFRRFLSRHALGVKAMAAADDDLLRAVLPWLTFETTAGQLPLPEVAARFGTVRYTATVDEFRQVAPVAAAQGIGVVNAGYAYETEVLTRYAALDAEAKVELLLPGDLDAHVQAPPEDVLLALRGFVHAARGALDPLGVEVELRSFDPESLPALVLDDREARYRRNARASAAAADASPWAQMHVSVDDGGTDRRVLLLNHSNPTVEQIAAIDDPDLLRLSLESLYCQALLAGQHPMQAADTAALNRSFHGLIRRAVR